jgi:hypothetical protein
MEIINNNPNSIQLRTNRSWYKYFLLSLITFNIYGIVVMSHISEEINLIATKHDLKKTMHYCLIFFIFSWLTLGIAPLVWYHRISNRIGEELHRRNLPYQFSAADFWLWNILGSLIIIGPFVYLHKLTRSMNIINENYNING